MKTIKANQVDEISIDIEKPGVYTISVNPQNTWLALYYDGNIVKYGKNKIRFGAVDGKYRLKVRHDLPKEITYEVIMKEFM